MVRTFLFPYQNICQIMLQTISSHPYSVGRSRVTCCKQSDRWRG